MADLRTLKETDQEFDGFLNGTFSKQKRAIPRHYRKSARDYEITFELRNLDMVERPNLLKIWWKAIRPNYLSYTLSPMIAAVLILFVSNATVSWVSAFSALFSVFFLQIAAHLLNDYFDHLRGTDHVRWRGSQIIQNGWLPAYAIQRGSIFFLSLALLAAIPVAVGHPEVFVVLGLVGLLGVISFSGKRLSLKDSGWGELSLFFLTGPVLLGGLSWVSLGRLELDLIFLGVVFGTVSALSYFLKNFEELLSQDRTTSTSFAKRLGFDRSQALASRSLYAVPLLMMCYAATQEFILNPWWIVSLGLLLPLHSLAKSLRSIESCLSSTSRRVRRDGLRMHWLLGIMVCLVFLSFHLGPKLFL